MKEQDVFAWARLYGCDFPAKLLEFRVEGDLPTAVVNGRYAIVEAERFRMVLMQAKLWRESREKTA